MKRYHENQVQEISIDKTGTPPSAQALPLVKDSAVSPQALALFRLIARLSRRAGYACVNLLETLAGMFGRSISTTRARLAELLAAGWLDRSQTRKGGRSRLFFRPLVRVAALARGLFSAPVSGGYSGGYYPQKLAVTPSTPNKTAPVGKETTTDTKTKTGISDESPAPCPVAVSILKEVCTESEALELAREASRQNLTEEQVKRVLDAYKGQLANIRNRGAWLREALRRGFSPAAPVSTHASDQGGRPVRVIAAPAEYRTLCEALPKNTAVASCGARIAPSGAPMGIDRVRAVIAAKKAGLA